jgi:hypothetical protein
MTKVLLRTSRADLALSDVVNDRVRPFAKKGDNGHETLGGNFHRSPSQDLCAVTTAQSVTVVVSRWLSTA